MRMPMPVLEEDSPQQMDSGSAVAAPRGTSVSMVTTIAELAELAEPWNALAGEIPFRRHEWLATWWRHFCPARGRLAIVAIRDRQRQLEALMPWYLDRSLVFGRVLRLLGSGAVCSDYVSMLAAPQQQSALAARLAEWLDDDFASEWDAIDLDQVLPHDPALATLVDSLRQRGHMVDERPGMNCWRISLPESWDAYLAGFSKRRRDRIRRADRQWFESGRAQLKRPESVAELNQAWEIFVDLHQRRRQSLGQPGCFANAAFAQFLQEAVWRLFEEGRVQLSLLRCDGPPAAVQLDLAGGDTVYGYQMGMDPDLAAFEPGNLRMIGVLRRALEEGVRQFDLLRGDEPYKAHWQAEPVPLVRWRVVNKQLSAHCRHRVWLGGEAARQLARRARDRWSSRKQPTRPNQAPSDTCELTKVAPLGAR